MTSEELFAQIRDDYRLHGSKLRNRGLWALAVYRFGRYSLALRQGFARWFLGKLYGVASLFIEVVTGIHMDRHVIVGKDFLIIHPSTIFINPRVVIGDRCAVMHNVTIGTNMGTDVPVIGNDVFIGCGASILGRLTVGDRAKVAANSLVINDVPAGTFVVGVPARAFNRPAVAEAEIARRVAEGKRAGDPLDKSAKPTGGSG